MFQNKSAKEQGIDTTRKFRVVDDYNGCYPDKAIIGDILELVEDDNTSFPYFKNVTKDRSCSKFVWRWDKLEYEIPSEARTSIPPYILCSTPELAKRVLEKIERESDLKWGNGKKPTDFIYNNFFMDSNNYPEMIIRTNCEHLLYASKKYYQKEEGITDFTTAEEYLGLKQYDKNYFFTESQDFTTYTVPTPYNITYTITNPITVFTMAEEYLWDCVSTKMFYLSITKPTGNKIMNKILEFAKNLTLSEDDKILKKLGLIDEQGGYTLEYRVIADKKLYDDCKLYVVGLAKKMLEEEK